MCSGSSGPPRTPTASIIPDLARESLTDSIAVSKSGVKILNDAMAVIKK